MKSGKEMRREAAALLLLILLLTAAGGRGVPISVTRARAATDQAGRQQSGDNREFHPPDELEAVRS